MYLDANAHVSVNNEVFKKLSKINSSILGHSHALSPSRPGILASKMIEKCREKIADLIGAKSSNQIIFTNGCTEACNWAIHILCGINKNNILFISKMEHPAIMDALKLQIECSGLTDVIRSFDTDLHGVIKLDNLSHIDIGKSICIHVQNEIGTIQPIKNINTQFILSDMSQSLGKIDVNVSDLNVDIAVFGAHKYGGLPGVGFMYLKYVDYWSEFGTGSRYDLDIPGTPNILGIASASLALKDAISTLETRQYNMIKFRDVVESGLKEKGFKIIGEKANRAPNVSFVMTPEGISSRQILYELGKQRIFVGLGSACGSLYGDHSSLMENLGYDSSVDRYFRISQWGEYDDKHAKIFLNVIYNILKNI